MKHGVYPERIAATLPAQSVVTSSGVPLFIGTAPVQVASNAAKVGRPVLCENWSDVEAALGYSEDWERYTLCEAAYSHFRLYGRAPAFFVNLLDPATMVTAVGAADVEVVDHRAKLPLETVASSVVVKASGGEGEALVFGVDYEVYYTADACVVEMITDTGATQINVAYNAVDASAVTADDVAIGLECVEMCAVLFGVAPDLLCAPKFSADKGVAAVMAAKAEKISGIFSASAVIDLAAGSVDAAIEAKTSGGYFDKRQILCWGNLKHNGKVYHLSTQLTGLMSWVDASNDGCPCESPSNKALYCDAMVDANGEEIVLPKAEADKLNAAGIVTVLGFVNGRTAWGNYTAAHPTEISPDEIFIPVNRMLDFIGNSFAYRLWAKIDRPMNRRLVETVVDETILWLNGLVGAGYLLGYDIKFSEEDNPIEDLMAGIVRIRLRITPPSPMQEVDVVLEYTTDYLRSALMG